jgi:HSP20 family protein
MAEEKKGEQEFDLSNVIGGRLNILGLTLDLGKLLSAPEEVKEQLEELRDKLKQAGGKEVVSDEEWQRGGVRVSGYVSTRGLLGDSEYHIGTTPHPRGSPRPGSRARPSVRRNAPHLSETPETAEVAEPAVDLYHEDQGIVVVAEVPGVGLEEMELKVEGSVLTLATKPGVRRQYRKAINLGAPVDQESLRATCRNGVLEARFKKLAPQ